MARFVASVVLVGVDREDGNVLRHVAESVRRVEDLLAHLPSGVAGELRGKIATLRQIILEQRPPAFVLVGRRGAGKSSFVNALYGERVAEVGHVVAQTGRGKWFDVATDAGAMAILDTRGVQEGSRPKEEDEAESAVASIAVEVGKRAPDVLVFVVKATEVDAGIDGDLDALEAVVREIARQHRTRVPIVAVATHADVLEPKDVDLRRPDAFAKVDVEEKLARLAEVEAHLEQKVRGRASLGAELARCLAVSTYQSFRADGTVRADARYRIDELARALFLALPDAGRGVFVRIAQVRALQEELAGTLTKATAALAAAIAAAPIPVADLVPITSLQVGLVAGIAWLSGRPMDPSGAEELLAGLGVNVGVAFVFREAARALVKYVFPGAGSAVSGAVAFAGTMGVGAAARAYFLRGATIEEAKAAMKSER